MDECKQLGIDTLGPDINESRITFSVNKNNQIRFGLAAIKGMGASAAEAVIAEREQHGVFKDVFDLVERVNLNSCNKKCVEALVYSGALDSLGIQREQYFGISDRRSNSTFVEALLSYGAKYQVAKKEEENSLFGGFDAIEIAKPIIPEVEEWSDLEKLNKEKELIGIYLSAHPLDTYSFILKKMCNVACKDIADKEVLAEKNLVQFAGIITKVEELTSKRGNRFGRITMEDFEAPGTFYVFGQNWNSFYTMFREGNLLYIKGRYDFLGKFAKEKSLIIDSVTMMSDVAEKMVEKMTICVSSSTITEELANDLCEQIEKNKGRIPLYFSIEDSIHNATIQARSADYHIDLTASITDFLNKYECFEYTIN